MGAGACVSGGICFCGCAGSCAAGVAPGAATVPCWPELAWEKTNETLMSNRAGKSSAFRIDSLFFRNLEPERRYVGWLFGAEQLE